jgi:hypothetical protein
MKTIQCTLTIALAAVLIGSLAPGQSIRVRDNVTISFRGGPPSSDGASIATNSASSGRATIEALAWHGQSVPGGGTLYPLAASNPALVDPSGRIAFMSRVSGVDRNQGIFLADIQGLYPIAIGCGGGGGSGNPGTGVGDPTPIGGTFSGFFGGTTFAPPINAAGDILFIADVDGGSAPRALFLYRGTTQDIIKIAAVGDPSPLGGTLEAVGPGSMNDQGQIAFLGWEAGTSNINYLKWEAGTLTKIAAVGDPAPGGGTFTILGSEYLTFVDTTKIPIGPVPCINNHGQIAFRAILSGGLAGRGFFLSTGGVHQWFVKAGDPAPGGGTFFDFWGPILNDSGEIAFFGDYKPTPGTFSAAWFVSSPAGWRKALEFGDVVGGGDCVGLAVSRSPMTPLDDAGNLMIWCNVRYPGGSEYDHMVVSAPDGPFRILAKEGDATPIGGSYGGMQAWPSMNQNAQGTLSAYTPGAPGGKLNTHFLASSILTWQDLGYALPGFNGEPLLAGAGSLAANSAGTLDLTSARPLAPAYLFIGFSAMYMPFMGGTVVPSLDVNPILLATDGSGAIPLAWTAWPAGLPPDTELYFQYWIVDAAGPLGAAASNALKATTP